MPAHIRQGGNKSLVRLGGGWVATRRSLAIFQFQKAKSGGSKTVIRYPSRIQTVNGKLKLHQFGRSGSRKVHHLVAGRFVQDLRFQSRKDYWRGRLLRPVSDCLRVSPWGIALLLVRQSPPARLTWYERLRRQAVTT